MGVTEIRAFPVNSTVVMRSTLFALANLGATLQTYNEDSGVIVATVSRWLGLQRQEVVARVRSFEQTCQLELDAPDVEKARELLQLIATYVRDGGRVQANATMQWIDLQRQQASKAKRQELSGKARTLLSGGGGSASGSNLPAVVAEGSNLPMVQADKTEQRQKTIARAGGGGEEDDGISGIHAGLQPSSLSERSFSLARADAFGTDMSLSAQAKSFSMAEPSDLGNASTTAASRRARGGRYLFVGL